MSGPKTWCPIWADKDGNEIIVLGSNFCSTDRDEAQKIQWGMQLVEAVLLGLTRKDLREMDGANCPHVAGKIGMYNVIVIAGPMFDEAVTNYGKERVAK